MLTGYEKDPAEAEQIGINTEETMLSLFITLEPPLPQPTALRPRFESFEDTRVLKMIHQWKTTLGPIKSKDASATAIDLSGKTVLVSRFIRPQTPPETVDTLERILAFVSMIPYLEDRTALSASINLWSTSDQFLEIGAGDEAEHAILLCNYFLYLGKKAWVVVGKGIPEGKSAYVMVEEADAYQSRRQLPVIAMPNMPWNQSMRVLPKRVAFYNPLTGKRYSTSDSNCPLTEIHCLFNQENVSSMRRTIS